MTRPISCKVTCKMEENLTMTLQGLIGTNLIPPIRTLIGHLEDWLTKSNFVHGALQLLGGVIGDVSGVLGTLIGWVSGFVGWLETGNPYVQVFEGLLYGV